MKMKKTPFFLLLAVLFLGGCSLAPPYFKPDVPVPEAWPEGPDSPKAEAPAASELNWREFFTDERLVQLIETALANNQDMHLAALNVEKARSVYGIQKASLYPSVSANASGAENHVPANLSASGSAGTHGQYEVNLGMLSWEIDFFGRIRNLKDQALEQFLATQQGRRATQILIVSSVAGVYLSLAADRENLHLARTTFETQKQSYDLIRKRLEVGLATELDLNRAQTQVDTARGDIAAFTQLVAKDKNALAFLTGSMAGFPDELLPEDLSGVKPPREISTGIPSDVLLNRPDILQTEGLLKAANANIGAARAALFPRISLTTTFGTASEELSGLFGHGSEAWLVSPQASLAIFDPRLRSAVEVTKTEKKIALAQYQKAIQTAFREVADALAVHGTVGEQLAAQQSLVNAADQTFRLSNARYDNGIDSYLSVLDAQRSLYSARRGLVSLRLLKMANQVKLYEVLGGGGDSV